MNGAATTTGRASEQGHWYKPDGTPVYEIENKSKPGAMRAVTLRDARPNGWVPGATTILKVAANPALMIYRVNQALESMATLPEIENESLDDRMARARIDAGEHARKAAEFGTTAHSAIEDALKRPLTLLDPDNAFDKIAGAVRDKLAASFEPQAWACESSFAAPQGYGGKIDATAALANGSFLVGDFKGRDWAPADKPPRAYESDPMQLAAYAHALGPLRLAKCWNLYFSRSHPGLVHLHVYEPDEIETAWQQFELLLRYWQLSKGMG